jgi:S-adenosylmethionine:tRNA ribosyltransferase-isomerase
VGGQRERLMLRENLGRGVWHVRPNPPAPALEVLGRVGRTPLPPYIRRTCLRADTQDRQTYQTVYAARPGAVAAPTAGLHFTQTVLDRLTARGIETAPVTLHVGLGTFAPVKVDRPERHRMHAEWYEISPAAASAIERARSRGRRIVAVGTTSVRVLESAAAKGRLEPSSGWTDIFIYPPYDFRVVGALLTNFHLPRSTLLMLAAAFCAPGKTDGAATILSAYREAIDLRYRFYSYGDAMLIE